jgi:hypothetical protein
MSAAPKLPWFTSRTYLYTLARLVALAARPTRRRPVIWYHRPPVVKKGK